MLNIDNYYDLHDLWASNITSSNQMVHMITILVNIIKVPAIFFFSTNNFSIYESEIVNYLWLKQILQIEMNYLSFSYN